MLDVSDAWKKRQQFWDFRDSKSVAVTLSSIVLGITTDYADYTDFFMSR